MKSTMRLRLTIIYCQVASQNQEDILDISLSPISKTPTSALHAAHVEEIDVAVKDDKPRKRKMTFAAVKHAKRRQINRLNT